MSYLISAWPADKEAGPVEQTRHPTAQGADSVMQYWARDPPIGAIRISVFDELAGCVLYTLDVIPPALRDQKSTGHITFHGDFEYFEFSGQVYRALRSAPLVNQFKSGCYGRFGRWECSRAHFERYRSVILTPIK